MGERGDEMGGHRSHLHPLLCFILEIDIIRFLNGASFGFLEYDGLIEVAKQCLLNLIVFFEYVVAIYLIAVSPMEPRLP